MSRIDKLLELLESIARTHPNNDVATDAKELHMDIQDLQSLAKPSGCSCQGWGCYSCCSSEAELRQRQGTFS